MGLSAFAIQGALYAVEMSLPMSAVFVAAVLTRSEGWDHSRFACRP
ncbi:hypothetical protein KP78_25350 [Jeotgalibacillus soli]|uniref:Uncharacterized protein n=1 Tax=Jeotgalibacillus soli TaxID=889306 RepID=A0A0C2VKK8_9BACL|nr:hypothetical protein KP78_25350 [Jeotgalibacillus soli]